MLDARNSADYQHAVIEQAQDMIALAQSRHADFLDDCLSDPGKIKRTWKNDVTITYKHALLDDFQQHNDSTIIDHGTDLLGLYIPALGPNEKHLITVQYRYGDFTPRRNFTLLHELGHYLQWTDDNLANRIIATSTLNFNKRFEEDACNRFASFALLPTHYVQKCTHGGVVDADLAARLYDEGRSKDPQNKHLIRVSRPVIARRLAEFLDFTGTVALVTNDKLTVRAHSNGQIDYDGELLSEERQLIDDLNATRKSAMAGMLASPRGNNIFASITTSYGRRGMRYRFIVLQQVEKPLSE
ncbi:ImmA/IrrE family metallo-endopeptidase [Bifidobacterium imperatoris]|uniref:ImmA/IrrE family metallo-endopeptidase n=1 Tax=Bifidobacterium imperatoris TaxID=2020965 RepID=A0A2N5IT77_9BIFI|nr:ImmA/IrrE family metallo-endopeptidase [Bifidobacterium imperatoris]PLS25164.1 hypothetical protein Tam1G_0730 [Bifidobacterium imperatoris]QSY57721.1 ImmA/IrrE family metallo-endopeptidase [Bifidobacterium imperatoris]